MNLGRATPGGGRHLAVTVIPLGRPLASVDDAEIGEALELRWGRSAVTTWNARRGAAAVQRGTCRSGYPSGRPWPPVAHGP